MDVIEQFDVLVPAFERVAEGTGRDALDSPTPCAEWVVRDLFGHLTGGATTFAAAIRGEDAPEPPTPTDDTIATTTVAAVSSLDKAFRGPGALEQIVSTPFGELPGEVFARILAFDLLMHTWDLARSTGQEVDVPDEVVHAVDGFARQAISAEMRGPHTFGPEVEPPAGASALDRLAAFSGRTP